ncbi:hypothetical protein N9W41_00850 [bacterium]|nr:hypothetical protein [bacterium]
MPYLKVTSGKLITVRRNKVKNYSPLRELPQKKLTADDTIFIFGEVFSLGYVNGLIKEATSAGSKIIYSTVGRRNENGELQSLSSEQLEEKNLANQKPLINIPLECGFDLTADSKGITPCDQLKDVKLSKWQEVQLDWPAVEESKAKGEEDFKKRVHAYSLEAKKHVNPKGNVYFAHTMAGGVPRTKIVMPLFNKVFKGYDKRYLSSKEFWDSEIGKLCEKTFSSVTADTFDILINATKDLRNEVSKNKQNTYYLAFGYHGNELFINNEYRWQSYAPYLQGFAKLQLENYAKQARANDVNATVYNVPEILTNSSSIFLGIEVALYPLIGSLIHESRGNSKVKQIIADSEDLLKDEYTINDVLDVTNEYFNHPTIKNDWSKFDTWPQHNGPDQMKLMREASQKILSMHKDQNKLMTYKLSEVVFDACGMIMLNQVSESEQAAHWICHDLVSKHYLDKL